MTSKLLTKLIDKAIVPAVLLLTTRIVSIVLISSYLNFDFNIGLSGFTFQNSVEYVFVNSYSTLVMAVVLVVGLIYVLIKSYVFHDSHIKPRTTAKLFELKIPNLIQSSFDIYSQAAIWISYAYLLLIVSAIMNYNKLIYSWVFFIVLGMTVITTVFFIFDIENEMKLSKKLKDEYDEDTVFLEMEDK